MSVCIYQDAKSKGQHLIIGAVQVLSRAIISMAILNASSWEKGQPGQLGRYNVPRSKADGSQNTTL